MAGKCKLSSYCPGTAAMFAFWSILTHAKLKLWRRCQVILLAIEWVEHLPASLAIAHISELHVKSCLLKILLFPLVSFFYFISLHFPFTVHQKSKEFEIWEKTSSVWVGFRSLFQGNMFSIRIQVYKGTRNTGEILFIKGIWT